MTGLARDQYDMLIQGIAPNRVSQKQGQSHVEAWDIRRHLIRIFGFGGFDIETIRCDLVKEIETKQGDRSRWTIVYRAEVRLTVKAPDGSALARYEDGATGDAINMPSVGDAHDFALKTALSQALKRCAVNLGDQFGLALYNGGRPGAVVLRSLVSPEGEQPTGAPMPVDDAPVLPEPTSPAADELPAPEEPEQAPNVDRPGVRMVEQSQHRKMHALWRDLGLDGDANRDKRLEITAKVLGMPSIESSAHLTFDQAERVIAAQQTKKRHMAGSNA